MNKLKLLLILMLSAWLSAWALPTGVRGVVVDARSGQPVAGATVLLDEQGFTVSTGPAGDFQISDARPGRDMLVVIGYGYYDHTQPVEIIDGIVADLGKITLNSSSNTSPEGLSEFRQDLVISEQELEDEEGNTQAIGTLTGATDNPFYQAASYDFSIMRFRMRGYQNEYNSGSMNGINFNDAVRGRFNYSMIGGMNQAFRSKSIGLGLEATSFSFGEIGGASNINLYAKDYAPGFRGSVAYTNSNYKYRAMITYSTGLRPNGWALTVSAVGRYADEGIIPGSFYKSAGYFIALQKVLNPQHSISLVTFGAPTRRSSNSATVQEAYDLAGNNLYNTNWGWQDGKKRSARVVETFDPTAIFNWIWKPNMNTTLNTGAAFHKSFYASTALGWYNAPDPRPDYYRYLPSYAQNEAVKYDMTQLWLHDESTRQINWNRLYQVNLLNNYIADNGGADKGSTYMIEKRHSNQASWALNTNLNTRLTDVTTLQGGLSANFTRSSYYKTVADLLGGRYWLDIDQYAERDFPATPDLAQNDLDNPNRRVVKGDRFGYNYNIDTWQAQAWKQMVFTLPRWDLSYSLRATYTRFQRDGKMRNGRAPENSLGRGKVHEYVNAAIKAGATFKIDGRNSIIAHAYFGTRPPMAYNAYVSPRTKDDVITGLQSETIWSGDIGYQWNYRSFKGVITAYYTDQRGATERYSFYDDTYSTFMNYAMTGIHKVYRGIELGLSYKITPSVTISGAANWARYLYRNRPTGTRSYENGSEQDIVTTVYLKNFHVSGTPEEAYNIAINWAAPKMWFFEINGTWLNRAYVDISPVRHEPVNAVNADGTTPFSSVQQANEVLSYYRNQERLNEALVIGASIGHVIYLNRTASLNINLNLDNILNNRKIMTGGYQQGRGTIEDFQNSKFPNKYYYAQGFKLFLNVGVRF